VDVGVFVVGVQLDGAGVISDRLVVLAPFKIGEAAVVIEGYVFGFQLDGAGVIGDRLIIFAVLWSRLTINGFLFNLKW
jgi:hypothetical protein